MVLGLVSHSLKENIVLIEVIPTDVKLRFLRELSGYFR